MTVGEAGLDARHAAAIVGDQFPELRSATVEYLGEGCDSTAFEIDGRWVFRFPKRADVEAQLLVERRVLPILAAESPLPLPSYRFHGEPSSLFPRRFGGYARLAGEPALGLDLRVAPFDAWSRVLADFLSWLHNFPVDEAARLGVPHGDLSSLVDEVRTDALDDLEHLRTVAPDAPLDMWRSYLAAAPAVPARPSSPPVLVHRDLAAEHVLYDARTMTLTGVIDWSDMAIDDRSVDFAGLYHWGGQRVVDAVLADYRGTVTADALARARYLARCRAAEDVKFGLRMKRQEYIASGLETLARLT
jgi:aminoglycoside phosphotransferase (APT) family kinase protein